MSESNYRFEISKTGRAGCVNTACKKENIKIDKGELRFGTLATIADHQSWKWKHWGCVTPLQLANVLGQLGSLEELNLPTDLEILDGWEELTLEAQEKVQRALEQGHVDDEDWKGDPELNRRGMRGINKRTPKTPKTKDAEENDAVAEGTPSKATAKKSRKKAKAEEDMEAEDEPVPKKKGAPRKRKVVDDDDDDEPIEEKLKPNPRAKKVKAEEGDDVEETKPKRTIRAKRVKAEDSEPENVKTEQPEGQIKEKLPARGRKVKLEDAELQEEEPPKKKAAARSKKVKADVKTEDEAEREAEAKPAPKKRTAKGKAAKETKESPEPEPEAVKVEHEEEAGEIGGQANGGTDVREEAPVEEKKPKPKGGKKKGKNT